MGQAILGGLPFIGESLTPKEASSFLDWYFFLQLEDRINVDKVLSASYDCILYQAPRYSSDNVYYFVMNAIGSTARAEPDYEDVDLLFFTNTGLRGWDRLKRLDTDLELRLKDDFDYVWNLDPEEAYLRKNLPKRLFLGLTPLRGAGKKIHLTLQPGITSEEEWAGKDNEQRIVIYRDGDVSGRSFKAKYSSDKPLRGFGVSLVVD